MMGRASNRGIDGSGLPLLSVIIPTHQVAPWIDELLSSVLDTPIAAMEVVVVDDHSTDGTRERVAEYANADPRIRLVLAHDRGGANARNIGLRNAQGTYVAFADGDDIVPVGAYERLVSSLEQSGSDIAFGDWLKFSSIRTWQPSHNWHIFDEDVIGSRLSDHPALIRGRAVWNKVFRRTFLEEIGLEFPEVARSNDIVPMTTAYLASRQIDVIADCVYLYRDRPGTTSMSSGASVVAATRSYFEQETACARLISARRDEKLSATYSALIFDADGWLHISRFLRGIEDPSDIDVSVVEAARALVASTSKTALKRATPHKCVLWALLGAEALAVALAYNSAEESARESKTYDLAAMLAWVRALEVVVASTALPEADRGRMAVDGLATIVLHHAKTLSFDDLELLVARVVDAAVLDKVEPGAMRPGPLQSIVAALRAGDAEGVATVSRLRERQLVVDHVIHDGPVARIGGEWDPSDQVHVWLVARRQRDGAQRKIAVAHGEGRWSAVVEHGALEPGRWELSVEYAAGAVTVEQSVVTARMALPPLTRSDRVQVMSDRKRGWRVVLDVRPPLLMRAARRVSRQIPVVGRS